MRALLIVAAACALVAVGCGSGPTEAAPPSATTEAEQPSATADRPLAPALEGTSLDGEPIALADYRGRAVLINVWSSW